MDQVYLDYNSTTPVDPLVLETMLPYFNEKFGNAASKNHGFGITAKEAVDLARKQIASVIGCGPKEIIFTSGATESINLAIKGFAQANQTRGNHIVSLKTEHKAVLDTCLHLEEHGFEVTYLNVNTDGILDIDELKGTIKDSTIMVAVLHANNEIGVIQPIEEIAKICKGSEIAFFVDAAQSFGKIQLDVKKIGIDLLCASGHKIYGPKGIGCLYINRDKIDLKISSQIEGGGHEYGFRSGTLNVPAIVGFGMAAEIAQKRLNDDNKKAKKLSELLISGLRDKLDGFQINGHLEKRLSGNINISFSGVNGDALLINMGEVAVSNGAACSSDKKEPSYVLKALGLSEELAGSSLRFGIGRYTTEKEINHAVNKVVKVVEDLRGLEELKSDLFNE